MLVDGSVEIQIRPVHRVTSGVISSTSYSSSEIRHRGTFPANWRKISSTCRLPTAYSASAAPIQLIRSSNWAMRASSSFSQ